MIVLYALCFAPLTIGIIYYLINRKEIKFWSEIHKKREIAVQMLIENRFDEALDLFEKERPWLMDKVLDEYFKNSDEDLFALLATDKYERLSWLESSKRRVEYYQQISDDDMTDEDWADLRASDF